MDTLPLGQIFTTKDERKWTDDDGHSHVHAYTVRARVTDMDARGFMWETIGIEDETGRPPESFAFTPDGGTTAWFALPLYLENGRMALV